MLVIDEIQQLVSLEGFLRRLGFDVLSLGKEILVTDALLRFTPELVIASEKGRHVDGVKLAQRLKRTVTPVPRVALCFAGSAPVGSPADLKTIDALFELPLAGEAGVRLISKLTGIDPEPLLKKFQKFAGAKTSREDQTIVVSSATGGAASSTITVADWDPKKNPGASATVRTERSNRYDQLLEVKAGDLGETAVKGVMPRERAAQAMAKLKKDSEPEKDELDRIQAEKIKFAEAMFADESKKKKP